MSDLLDVADMMKWFKVCRDTIWRWRREGHLPEPVRVGGKWFWTRDQIKNLVRRKRTSRKKV